MRRQPFILLSFSSSEKLRKAQETQSYQRIQCIGHTDFKGLSNAVTNTHSLLPSMGITRQKMVLAQSPTKWPTFAFTPENEYTLAFAQKIAHSGLHTETGGVSDGGGITTLGAFHTFRKPCAARCQNGVLCRFGILTGRCSRRTQKACGTAMRLCASLSRRRRGPAGLRNSFRFCRNCGLYALHSELSMHMRDVWYHYPRCALHVLETPDGRLLKWLICCFLAVR